MFEPRNRSVRHPKRFVAWFGPSRTLRHEGQTVNLSEKGLAIRAHELYGIGTILRVAVKPLDQPAFDLEGVVMWSNDPSNGMGGQAGFMGVRLTTIDPRFTAFVQRVNEAAARRPSASSSYPGLSSTPAPSWAPASTPVSDRDTTPVYNSTPPQVLAAQAARAQAFAPPPQPYSAPAPQYTPPPQYVQPQPPQTYAPPPAWAPAPVPPPSQPPQPQYTPPPWSSPPVPSAPSPSRSAPTPGPGSLAQAGWGSPPSTPPPTRAEPTPGPGSFAPTGWTPTPTPGWAPSSPPSWPAPPSIPPPRPPQYAQPPRPPPPSQPAPVRPPPPPTQPPAAWPPPPPAAAPPPPPPPATKPPLAAASIESFYSVGMPSNAPNVAASMSVNVSGAGSPAAAGPNGGSWPPGAFKMDAPEGADPRKVRMPRFEAAMPLNWGITNLANHGYTNNLSRSGLAITVRDPVAPGARLLMGIALGDGQVAKASGIAVWQRMASGGYTSVGVRLLHADERYLKLLETLARRR